MVNSFAMSSSITFDISIHIRTAATLLIANRPQSLSKGKLFKICSESHTNTLTDICFLVAQTNMSRDRSCSNTEEQESTKKS